MPSHPSRRALPGLTQRQTIAAREITRVLNELATSPESLLSWENTRRLSHAESLIASHFPEDADWVNTRLAVHSLAGEGLVSETRALAS